MLLTPQLLLPLLLPLPEALSSLLLLSLSSLTTLANLGQITLGIPLTPVVTIPQNLTLLKVNGNSIQT